MITDRQREILDVIIKEYINSAEPVSSHILANKYKFGICSATIRIEMQNLTYFGFLEKPYISSGRIPTDKAYRVFVDSFFQNIKMEDRAENLNNIFEDNAIKFETVKKLTDILANKSSSYIIISFPKKNISWQAGLRDIIKEPEFSDKDFIIKFLSFLEEFSKKQERLDLELKTKVFIGCENPFKRGNHFSMICSENILNNKERLRVSLIGPKRMNYYKNIKLINSLSRLIEENI